MNLDSVGGWKAAEYVAREEAPVETLLAEADAALAAAELKTAREHLTQAREDLSRRPTPDFSGCVHHSIAALEAVARERSGDPKATLGDVVARHAGKLRIRPPLDQAVTKLWGFSSEEGGRHGREGSEPTRCGCCRTAQRTSSACRTAAGMTLSERPSSFRKHFPIGVGTRCDDRR